MQRFEVVINGEGLERALTALNDAGIPTMGPSFTWSGSEAAMVGKLMFAVVDANASREAVAQVSAVLEKEGGDYTIERGVTFNPEDWTKRRD
jgi:hypothetical protein